MTSVKRRAIAMLSLVGGLALGWSALAAPGAVTQDLERRRVQMTDGSGRLSMRLDYAGRCVCDALSVGGDEVLSEQGGVYSGIQVGGQWHTTQTGIPSPRVSIRNDQVTVRDIRFGGGGVEVAETWEFRVGADRIEWRIERTYLSKGPLDDTASPRWEFRDLRTWAGGLLGHGGVAWPRLFDSVNSSYGVHGGAVTFWNPDGRACLSIIPTAPSPRQIASRFSRQPTGSFSLDYSVTDGERTPRHGLTRFLHGRQDVWAPFPVVPGTVRLDLTLTAPVYRTAFDRGTFAYFDGEAIQAICRTIARIGAVDRRLHGSNGYYSDCAVLHEPWIAQLGLAIDDPAYFRAYADTLDFQREHAISSDGRVKSRWAGTPGDALPGSYDACGFYEAQWGYLLDSQPSWVINVAELFDFTADRAWLRRQQTTCERVLDYLLRRDADGDGLVEMMTRSHREARGSDWIDVVWAAHENALVNAQMYWALTQWADLEELLEDAPHAERYRAAAAKLRQRFNQGIAEGGFWDPANERYVYWRDQDDSIHGTNLVIPVNFSAIGYGLCEDPARRAAILNRIEALMREERLFFWPLCFFPYAPGEAHPSQYPFPTYENGDLFLAWGELGTRCYARHDPAVPLKYVRNVLDQYAKDGLAYQRYRRTTQTGVGSDILANNASSIVGLYRNLYGVQPKHNRLYLEPHLPPKLNGTRLKYWLRDQTYVIDLSTQACQIAVEGVTLRAAPPFAIQVTPRTAEYFCGERKTPSLTVERAGGAAVVLTIEAWGSGRNSRSWTESGATGRTRHVVSDLTPNREYALQIDGARMTMLRSDRVGRAVFHHRPRGTSAHRFVIEPADG